MNKSIQNGSYDHWDHLRPQKFLTTGKHYHPDDIANCVTEWQGIFMTKYSNFTKGGLTILILPRNVSIQGRKWPHSVRINRIWPQLVWIDMSLSPSKVDATSHKISTDWAMYENCSIHLHQRARDPDNCQLHATVRSGLQVLLVHSHTLTRHILIAVWT